MTHADGAAGVESGGAPSAAAVQHHEPQLLVALEPWPKVLVTSKELATHLSRHLHSTLLEDRGDPVPEQFVCFRSKTLPAITLHDYLQRILRYADPGLEALLATKVLVHRLLTFYPECPLTLWNIFRVMLSVLLLSAKLTRDSFYPNPHYAKVVGVSPEELRTLEANMLALLSDRLWVTEETLRATYHELLRA
eukprot:m.26617 g.26617  ORF g.26617 m.26617 type:complete len:193 (+) comp8949_c0_seq1:111-689(+)